MDPLRRSGEWLESAMGLPHSPRKGAADPSSAAAGKPAGTPDWAAPGAHYPGEGAKAQVYPDDSAPASAAKATATPPAPKFSLEKMSPRAKAITEEVGRELEESPSIIG